MKKKILRFDFVSSCFSAVGNLILCVRGTPLRDPETRGMPDWLIAHWSSLHKFQFLLFSSGSLRRWRHAPGHVQWGRFRFLASCHDPWVWLLSEIGWTDPEPFPPAQKLSYVGLKSFTLKDRVTHLEVFVLRTLFHMRMRSRNFNLGVVRRLYSQNQRSSALPKTSYKS